MSDADSTFLFVRWLVLLPPTLFLLASVRSSAAGFVVQSVERNARVPWSRLRVATLARETVARALFSALRRLPWLVGRPPRATDDAPILLVPCPLWGPASMWLMARFLRARGASVWVMSFSREDQDLATRAEALEQRVDELLAATQTARVDLVCHGLGGLAAAWMLQHREAGHKILNLVTLGTPWRGTRMAAFLPGRAAIETRPESHHLDGLLPPAVPTMSIWCPNDPDVVPASSAAADPHQAIAVEGAGHVGLLVSARSCRAVWQALHRPLQVNP